MTIPWILAIKYYNQNSGKKWIVPRKGTPEHAEVIKIMKNATIDDGVIIYHNTVQGGELSILPNFFKKWLNEYGNSNINAIYVCRAPVIKIYQDLLNIFTQNGIKRKIKDLKFDNLFHTFLLYHMKVDNSMWLVERNTRLNVVKYDRYVKHPEFREGMKSEIVVIPKERTVKDMFSNHQKYVNGWNDVIFYDPVNNNCQLFVSNHLRANGLMTDKLNRLVNQDISKVLKDFPITRQFIKHIIALGLVIENLFDF